VLRLANQAEIVPTVMTATGAVLDLGRTRRIASRAQTYALIARDGGCSFPGCDRARNGANGTTFENGLTAARPISTI
jgi:hypothetical protein